MDGSSRRPHNAIHLTWVALILLSGVVAAAGCRGLLTTAAYLAGGADQPAEYAGLKDKKVAVVCRPLVSLTYRDSNVANDLASEVSAMLKASVRKIKVVDSQKVAEWLDEHGDWTDYAEVGKALDADMVVGIDLEAFGLHEGQTLYRGKAAATIRVCDCSEKGKVVFEKELPRMVYPPNAVIATSDIPESQFRRRFIHILADQISRHFYSHDPRADYVMDASVLD